ncbi:hypothetical protein GIB67_017558 [Kingdonia uniflora]|uniref:Protein kinase domain-containing protein n=1 Tax=Kingdonia uniflora TaxID=39325 RepID=A0A7J7LN46_9MAGN|nr:hypothetical protein GIB67_017558 [Kingdonia uniflora]
MEQQQQLPLSLSLLLLLLLLLLLTTTTTTTTTFGAPSDDARALLSFKSFADLHNNNLHFPINDTKQRRLFFAHCQWQGVKCAQGGKVVRLALHSLPLGGIFAPNSLSRLDQLRVLSLQNDSLHGPIPNLSKLGNLKTLFLDHNNFSGIFPQSLIYLHRVVTLDLSYNDLTGLIPNWVTGLDRVYYLHLESNRFNGSVPAFNQTSLEVFNVSGNNLTGAVPVTLVLSRFGVSSFLENPGLCGEILHKECRPRIPFFGSSPSPVGLPPAGTLGGNLRGIVLPQHSPGSSSGSIKSPLIVGLSVVVLVVIGSLVIVALAIKKKRRRFVVSPPAFASDSGVVTRVEEENELLEAKVKKVQLAKSGCLMFCGGEAQVYNLDQLMGASAEMLGRGTIGTTYKAVLDNHLIVCVKRLDAAKTAVTSNDMFERHMESAGNLRHPNLVPLRAYFQAKEERLIVYDFQPNGSLYSLIHGSRSSRAKPLHWTSCLKIAEDVAQGLSYIHQASRLIHGNLKSSNVLLGSDFEACLTDYCLSVLTDSREEEDSNFAAYRAPEIRKSGRRATSKSDVYSFGVLLLELLTGKPPSQHPLHMPAGISNWVRSVRDVDVGEENRLEMLLEVSMTCSLTSPEQRPTMWQVMKMIQEIKETVLMEDSELEMTPGFS